MLFIDSKVKISDNSGAVVVKLVKVYGSSLPRYARFTDIPLVTTRYVKAKHQVKATKKILKGQLHKAIITRTKKPVFFKDSSCIRFFSNAAVMIKKAQPRTFGGPKLAGTRVFGPIIYNEKLKKKFPKLYSLSSAVLKQ